ncbi:HipA domain-containing protein [Phaeobacter inhibens]|nr:HipA domain-containing protein [Phaeobacter inhibens]
MGVFFIFVVFVLGNILVANTDAHAKDYSMLLSGRPRLAPLYDISTVLHCDHVNQYHAQKLGGRKRKPADTARLYWTKLVTGMDVETTPLPPLRKGQLASFDIIPVPPRTRLSPKDETARFMAKKVIAEFTELHDFKRLHSAVKAWVKQHRDEQSKRCQERPPVWEECQRLQQFKRLSSGLTGLCTTRRLFYDRTRKQITSSKLSRLPRGNRTSPADLPLALDTALPAIRLACGPAPLRGQEC